MPGAGNATVDDPSLTERTVLMLADVRHRSEPALPTEDRDALARDAGDPRATLGDLVHATNTDESSLAGLRSPIRPW